MEGVNTATYIAMVEVTHRGCGGRRDKW